MPTALPILGEEAWFWGTNKEKINQSPTSNYLLYNNYTYNKIFKKHIKKKMKVSFIFFLKKK